MSREESNNTTVVDHTGQRDAGPWSPDKARTNRLSVASRESVHEIYAPAIQRSSVVERSAVNRLVVGSNPTAGANFYVLGVHPSKSGRPLLRWPRSEERRVGKE